MSTPLEQLLTFARDSLIAARGDRRAAHHLMAQQMNDNPALWETMGKAVSTLGLWLATGLAAGQGESDAEGVTWDVEAEIARVKEKLRKKKEEDEITPPSR